MLFKKTEWHSVASEFSYDIPDEDLISEFGSIKRFEEILSHQELENFTNIEPIGEEPTDEEQEKLWELVNNSDYDREDDWWTDRKGGYDVTFSYEPNEIK
jgi:hypothetical protein